MDAMKETAAKTATGAAVGLASYLSALTLTDIQAIASIFAALCTGFYFLFQASRSLIKLVTEYRNKK